MELYFYSTTYFSLFILFVSVMVGFWKFPILNREVKYVLIYFSCLLMMEIGVEILALYGISNLFLFPAYICLELIAFSLFFIQIFRLNNIIFLIACLVAMGVFLFRNEEVKLTLFKSVTHLMILIGCGYLLFQHLKYGKFDMQLVSLCKGLMFYFSVSVVLFAFISQLPKIELREAYFLWGTHNALLSIFYLFIGFFFFNYRTYTK